MNYDDVARIQIDRAIELYFQNDFISALTLAGAGEEILGGILKSFKVVTTQDEIVSKILEKHEGLSYGDVTTKGLNNARNILKHFVEDPNRLNFRPLDECVLMLLRAINNYVKIKKAKTELMAKFLDDERMNSVLDFLRNQ